MGSTPLEDLAMALRRLHRAAGEPSSHEIGKRVNYSHTTVAQALRMRRSPSWPVLQAVVECLGGDIAEFRSYWVAVRDAEDPLPGTQVAGEFIGEVAQHRDGERSHDPGAMAAAAADDRVVLRWKTRLETIEFFDKGLALQWIKSRAREGGADE